MIDNVISKLIHDKSCGIIVFSAAHRSRPLSQLIKHTAVVFRIARHDAIVCNTTPNLPPGDLLALVIDDWLPRTANYDEFSIRAFAILPPLSSPPIGCRHSNTTLTLTSFTKSAMGLPGAGAYLTPAIVPPRLYRPKSITYKAELDEKIAHEHAQGFLWSFPMRQWHCTTSIQYQVPSAIRRNQEIFQESPPCHRHVSSLRRHFSKRKLS